MEWWIRILVVGLCIFLLYRYYIRNEKSNQFPVAQVKKIRNDSVWSNKRVCLFSAWWNQFFLYFILNFPLDY